MAIKNIYTSNKLAKKGQALTELAIVGSILLFCVAMLVQFAMEANYQQQVQMEAFRKAQKISFYKSGPGASTSLVVVKDKSLIDPRDQFGYGERSPVMAAESVVWDNNQSAQYVKRFEDTPSPEDIPAMYFDIDNVNKASKVKLFDRSGELPSPKGSDVVGNLATASVPRESGLHENVFGFHTARFDKVACPYELTVLIEDKTHSTGRQYIEKKITDGQIWVARIEGMGFGGGEIETQTDYDLLMYPYYRDETDSAVWAKQRITDADVDYDGQMEYIIGADKNKTLYYIDYHDPITSPSQSVQPVHVAGAIDIDTGYTQVEPWDKDKLSGQYLTPEHKQGMIQNSEKSLQHTATKIVKEKKEGVNGISTQTTLNAKQTVIHEFRLNNGTVVKIPVEFSINENRYNWNQK